MEPLTPRDFDPDRIRPDEDAEPIVALSFLLELPHCLRIDDVVFLVSDRGGSWPGWNPDAIGYATGMSMPAPENDLKPRFRVEMKQARVDGWVPLLAAKQAFPDWQAVKRSERPSGTTTRGANELRSVVQITIYDPASETPLDRGESDSERFEHEIAEWVSRRLDDALSFLNQYLVILGGMRDEWHISSLSRIDLPRDTPWKLTILPTPEGWVGPSGTVDAHTTLRDDLPERRTEQEIADAVNIVHEARAGRAPFFQFLELYQASEHHLGSGRHDQSVIAACTATEVFINTLFRALWMFLERDPAKLGGVLKAPFRNQLIEFTGAFRSGSRPGFSTRSGAKACSTTTRRSVSTGLGWRPTGAMSKAPLGGAKTGPNPTDRAKGGRSARSSSRHVASRSRSLTTARTATITSC